MSKEYVILTDSCSDLSQELVNKCNIEVLPLQFEIDGKTYNHYPDGREYDFKNSMSICELKNRTYISNYTFNIYR